MVGFYVAWKTQHDRIWVECFSCARHMFRRKENYRLRLVVDARRLEVQDPPSFSLARGDALSALEVDPQSVLHVAQADVADCFHRMRLPPALRGFFGLPAIEARHLGITQLNGKPVSPGDMIVLVLYVADGFCVVTIFRSACSRTCV